MGGDRLVGDFLTTLPGGTAAAVAFVMALMFVLGFILDTFEIIFIVLPVTAPVLLSMSDMSAVWLGVLVGVNLQTSFLTPPFGFALFYLRGVAPPVMRTEHIYRGVIPFIALQLIGIMIVALYPPLVEWLPRVVFGS
ncbi:MAG: C4 dicarboxylate transporter permease [Rhodospirillaceae bacterium]|nr:MAG: C4 dicarboxylate transporter permease [Rhodospirillaceae bacterium]